MELERDPLKHAHARLFDGRARLTHEIALGEEMGPERCMSAGCERLRVAHSIPDISMTSSDRWSTGRRFDEVAG